MAGLSKKTLEACTTVGSYGGESSRLVSGVHVHLHEPLLHHVHFAPTVAKEPRGGCAMVRTEKERDKAGMCGAVVIF